MIPECPDCMDIFESEEELREHIDREHDNEMYQCFKCGSMNYSSEGADQHLRECMAD